MMTFMRIVLDVFVSDVFCFHLKCQIDRFLTSLLPRSWANFCVSCVRLASVQVDVSHSTSLSFFKWVLRLHSDLSLLCFSTVSYQGG
jgi:hypothetical protein